MTPAVPVRRVAWRAALLVLFVALVWLRMPGIMRHGRFWAEEGRIYFVNAATMPWWQALFRSELGYLNFPATAATLCAHYLVRLEDAPHVTTAIALLLQSLPAVLLITARAAWLDRPLVRLAAVLILALPPTGDEVWLNTINSQFHIAIAAALCLALDSPRGWARPLLVAAAPVCSPVSIALAPLFVLRAAAERTPSRVLQAAAILIGSTLQLGVFYHPMDARGHWPGPSVLVAIITARHLALPLLGRELAGVVSADLLDGVHQTTQPWLAYVAVLAATAALAIALALRRHATSAWMLAAAVTLAAASIYGALGDRTDLISVDGGMRYAYGPLMLTSLTVLALAASGTDRVSAIAWLFTAWLLAIGLMQSMLLEHFPDVANGPRWKPETAAWRTGPSHPMAIWPRGWVMHLPPRR